MIANPTEYQKAQEESRSLETGLTRLQEIQRRSRINCPSPAPRRLTLRLIRLNYRGLSIRDKKHL